MKITCCTFSGFVKGPGILFHAMIETVLIHRHHVARLAAEGFFCCEGVSLVEAPLSARGVSLGLSVCPALSFAGRRPPRQVCPAFSLGRGGLSRQETPVIMPGRLGGSISETERVSIALMLIVLQFLRNLCRVFLDEERRVTVRGLTRSFVARNDPIIIADCGVF